jgi:hypothetical protein
MSDCACVRWADGTTDVCLEHWSRLDPYERRRYAQRHGFRIVRTYVEREKRSAQALLRWAMRGQGQ